MECKITLGVTNATVYEWNYKLAGANAPQAGRTVVRLPRFRFASPGAFRALSFRNTSGSGVNAGHVAVGSTGVLSLLNTSGTSLNASSYLLTPGTIYDLQAAIHPGTNTGDGKLEYRLTPAGDLFNELILFTATNVNAGGGFTIKGFRGPSTSIAGAANVIKFGEPESMALATGWMS